MARANRHYMPGQVWHITHRCHKKEFLLKFDRDRRRWLHWLFEAKKRFGLQVLNYAVTSNHVHLLVPVRLATLVTRPYYPKSSKENNVLIASYAFTVVILMLASISPAFAADSKASNPTFCTREQFRACLDSEDRLKALRKTFDDHVAENNAEMFLIQTEAKAIAEEQKELDLTNEAQVNEFNKLTEAHNKMVKSANERAEKLKAEQDAYNAESIEHNARCATLVVKFEDREAVLKERKAARKH